MNTNHTNQPVAAYWSQLNHYKWLEQHLPAFFAALGVCYSPGIITAHGDKCYSYRREWEQAGIPFPHGVALYLLCYERPYSSEVRQTPAGWVAPSDWVVANYQKFREHLPGQAEPDRVWHELDDDKYVSDDGYVIAREYGVLPNGGQNPGWWVARGPGGDQLHWNRYRHALMAHVDHMCPRGAPASQPS